MRTSGGAEHIALGNTDFSSIRSGGTCWSAQAIHWLRQGKADRQAGRKTYGETGGWAKPRETGTPWT